MLTASSITLQFAAKPLFENVNVKFGDVSLDPGERMAWLRQDQFGYEDQRVLDVVMQGHADMWRVMQEKDAIYMNPEATEEDYLHAAELEAKFGEMGGAPEDLLDVKIVMMLANADPDEQVKTLRRMVDMFDEPATLQALVESKTPAQIVTLLRSGYEQD